MKKKVNVFGKKLPVFVLVLLGIGLVSAALITTWGVITGSVFVTQGLKLDDKDWDADDIIYDATFTSLEEKTVSSGLHDLKNTATVDATVTLDTTCIAGGTGDCTPATSTTEYVLDNTAGTCGGDTCEKRMFIRAEDVGVVDLNDLTSMSWEIYTALGYPSHVDVILADDIDNDLGNIDSITAEMAVDQGMTIVYIADNLPNDWVKTFELVSGDGHDDIDDSTTFWVTRHGAGTADAPYGTLAELKAGTVTNPYGDPAITISGATKVLGFEIEVDNWVEDSSSKIKNIQISGGDVVDKITILSNDELDFAIVTDFPKMMKPDTYTITTTVNAL